MMVKTVLKFDVSIKYLSKFGKHRNADVPVLVSYGVCLNFIDFLQHQT